MIESICTLAVLLDDRTLQAGPIYCEVDSRTCTLKMPACTWMTVVVRSPMLQSLFSTKSFALNVPAFTRTHVGRLHGS